MLCHLRRIVVRTIGPRNTLKDSANRAPMTQPVTTNRVPVLRDQLLGEILIGRIARRPDLEGRFLYKVIEVLSKSCGSEIISCGNRDQEWIGGIKLTAPEVVHNFTKDGAFIGD